MEEIKSNSFGCGSRSGGIETAPEKFGMEGSGSFLPF